MAEERAIAEGIVAERQMAPATSRSSSHAQSKADFLSKHRIEALSDGLFAIVMTLLVLDLRVPELEPPVSAHALAHAIASQRRLFFSFAMTFVLATVFWMLHQKTLRLIRSLDKGTVFLSLAPMLFVSLLPYSTATFGRYLENATASALYFGNQFAIALFIFCLWYKTGSSVTDLEEVRERRLLGVRLSSLALGCLLGALVGVRKPEYASMAFIIALVLSRFLAKRVLRI
jgi:uncharacterized membrane protein